jgi:hypothetical protein
VVARPADGRSQRHAGGHLGCSRHGRIWVEARPGAERRSRSPCPAAHRARSGCAAVSAGGARRRLRHASAGGLDRRASELRVMLPVARSRCVATPGREPAWRPARQTRRHDTAATRSGLSATPRVRLGRCAGPSRPLTRTCSLRSRRAGGCGAPLPGAAAVGCRRQCQPAAALSGAVHLLYACSDTEWIGYR